MVIYLSIVGISVATHALLFFLFKKKYRSQNYYASNIHELKRVERELREHILEVAHKCRVNSVRPNNPDISMQLVNDIQSKMCTYVSMINARITMVDAEVKQLSKQIKERSNGRAKTKSKKSKARKLPPRRSVRRKGTLKSKRR